MESAYYNIQLSHVRHYAKWVFSVIVKLQTSRRFVCSSTGHRSDMWLLTGTMLHWLRRHSHNDTIYCCHGASEESFLQLLSLRKIWVPTPDLGSSSSEGHILRRDRHRAATCYWELRTFNLVVRNIGSLSSPAGSILIVSTDPVI